MWISIGSHSSLLLLKYLVFFIIVLVVVRYHKVPYAMAAFLPDYSCYLCGCSARLAEGQYMSKSPLSLFNELSCSGNFPKADENCSFRLVDYISWQKHDMSFASLRVQWEAPSLCFEFAQKWHLTILSRVTGYDCVRVEVKGSLPVCWACPSTLMIVCSPYWIVGCM